MRQHSKNQSNGKQTSKSPKAAKQPWIGIDLGDRWSEVYELSASGKSQRTRLQTTPQAFKKYFGQRAGAHVALETGTHSPWASRLLTECGLDVTVANAREVRKIHQSDRKNDRADAEILARMLRFDRKLLAPIRHRSPQMQTDLAILRARDALVRTRTTLINVARGLVKSEGERLPKCSTAAFVDRVSKEIPRQLRAALSPLLEIISELGIQIKNYDQIVESLARKNYPDSALLSQVPSVGALTSVAYILTVAQKERFARSRDVGPYLGLVPRQHDSGAQQPQLSITKAGNSYLRRLLVGSAQYSLGPFGPDSNLRRYGKRLMERGGKNAKKRAVVAVARKLAILLHHLWVTGETYDPFPTALPA